MKNKTKNLIWSLLEKVGIKREDKIVLVKNGDVNGTQIVQEVVKRTGTQRESVAEADYKDIENKIRKGLKKYSQTYNQGKSVLAERYIPEFVEAAKKYPIFRDNPYLLPQIAILETSGGQNITRPNNLLNWGINYPGNNEEFSKMNVKSVLDKAISGLGERSPYYQDFRTGKSLTEDEIMNFAKVYEPANQSYGPNLVKGMEVFRR